MPPGTNNNDSGSGRDKPSLSFFMPGNTQVIPDDPNDPTPTATIRAGAPPSPLARIHKPFPIDNTNAGMELIRIITHGRARYSLRENNTLSYPSAQGFARSRIMQTDSEEYMKFLNRFLQELNMVDIPMPVLREALDSIQKHGKLPDTLQEQHSKSLDDLLYHFKLYEYSRNAFPFGPGFEDSNISSRILGALKLGSVNFAETEQALVHAIMFKGVSAVPDPQHSGNCTYEKKTAVTTHKFLDAKVEKKSLSLQLTPPPAGSTQDVIDDYDNNKDSFIQHLAFMVATHVQHNGTNVAPISLGPDIYENIRFMQLLLYNHNLNLELPANAQSILNAQIDALLNNGEIDAAKANLMKAEVGFLCTNAKAFAAELVNRRGGRSVPHGLTLADGTVIWGVQTVRENLLQRLNNSPANSIAPPTPAPPATPPPVTLTT